MSELHVGCGRGGGAPSLPCTIKSGRYAFNYIPNNRVSAEEEPIAQMSFTV